MANVFFIHKGEASNISFEKSSGDNARGMFIVYVLGVGIFFLIVMSRMFQLTVVKGEYYANLAFNNRAREIIIEAPRGTILDRKGIVLASNTKPNLASIEDRIPSKRMYHDAASFISHVIGYRQIADPTDLNNDSCINKLISGDAIGKKGIEQVYDCELRGEHGKKLVEVDAFGKVLKTLSVLAPHEGKDIQISIDSQLQQQAFKLMENYKGAVVGLKPKTGEVLVMVSTPGYDPQLFEDGAANQTEELILSEDKALFNRATEGTYPPGSVYKMFIAAAGLEEGVITAEETIQDNGVLEAGPLKFHNWYFLEYGRTEGEVDMVKALKRSNDIYFYVLGAKLGPEKMKRWAEMFGFQNPTGIALAESVGIVPFPFWKEDTLGEKWYLGDTYNSAIGQGYVSATPLQVAQATAVFANDGTLCVPQILKVGKEVKPQCRDIEMSKSTYNTIREGMKQTCETGGTAWPFFDFSVAELVKESTTEATLQRRMSVGCKTGTAESHAESGKPHAWFTIFAPYDDPEIVLTVLVEEGGQGSDVASPIAKDVLKKYFERNE
ncbi:MAG: penicillin-binding transpeptidase domain-containing protein [bacterium]|nr:penicillin-binding transpeptidase domain-containing protein [bacterium]